MSALRKAKRCLVLLLALQPLWSFAATAPTAPQRDGQNDFDFNFGGWNTHIRRLQHPLSGANDWTEMNGTVVVNPIWGGKAQIEEIEADGPNGHFEGMTLFLYNPPAHQWGMYFASSGDGTANQPGVGEFKDGRGEFYSQELYEGRAVLVRMVWSDIKTDSHHVEQSFSVDGGHTWEPNFIGDLTRNNQAATQAKTPPVEAATQQHGFDWQFGAWNIQMSRLLHPLTGSKTWTPLNGTVAVRKLWGGRANLAEIDTQGSSGHLEFLALRLYNPESKQWNLLFAHSNDGVLNTPALVGEFKDGRGVFYDQEPYQGRAILVRFTFQSLNAGSSRDEQAFSADGGKTWEVNWINRQTRQQPAVAARGITVQGLAGTNAYLYLDSIEIAANRAPAGRAQIEIHRQSGIRRVTRILRRGDNLHDLSDHLEQYRGFVVSDINALENTIAFTNGVVLAAGEAIGDVSETQLSGGGIQRGYIHARQEGRPH